MKQIKVNEEFVIAGFVVALFAVPFCVATYVPAVDLPQHLAQIRLFWETVHGKHEGMYLINWFSPNLLAYVLLGAVSQIASPVMAGKLTMLLLVVAWVLGVFFLARFRGRGFAAAMLASLFVFSHCMYWGLINHLIGFPVFILWLYVIGNGEPSGGSTAYVLKLLGCAVLLLFSHVLWLGMGVAALFIIDVHHRTRTRFLLLQGLVFVPVAVFLMFWLPRIEMIRQAGGFDTGMVWVTFPWERLSPSWMLDAVFGGMYGIVEPILGVLLLGWILLILATAWRDRFAGSDPVLLWLAGILFCVVLFAPDKYLNTFSFSSRWAPVAVSLLLLGLPGPKLPRTALMVAPLLLITILTVATTITWKDYNDDDLFGLSEALALVPENSKVLGLDLIKESGRIKGRPYLQMFAYAQALHGGELNFSFAEHGSGIIIYRVMGPKPWQSGLEWYGERATVGDLTQFDEILINAGEKTHALLQGNGVLKPLTDAGYWRLYRSIQPPQKSK